MKSPSCDLSTLHGVILAPTRSGMSRPLFHIATAMSATDEKPSVQDTPKGTINLAKINVKQFAMCALLYALSAQAFAQSSGGITLPKPGGLFNDFVGFMQNAANFITGPYATFFCLGILTVAIVLWNFAPKEGFMMIATKALASCFALLSLAPLIMSVRS